MVEDGVDRIVQKWSHRSRNLITMPESNHARRSSSRYSKFMSQILLPFLFMTFELDFM